MLDEIVLPECPGAFKKEAENLVRIIYNRPLGRDYHNIGFLDKLLTWAYWTEIDGLGRDGRVGFDLETWYLKYATPPDLITRARRWLVENRYFILKTNVAEAAQEAAVHFREQMKRG